MVKKHDGSRQAFNPDKLLRGLMLASEKRPIESDQLRAFAYAFEDDVQLCCPNNEISSEEIGRLAMNFLLPLDGVAYMRFASVCRKFDRIENFLEEIQDLQVEGIQIKILRSKQ